MGRPPAIDRQSRAGDRCRRFAGEKDRQRAQFLDARKMLVGLLRQQHVVDDLFARNAVRPGLAVDLRLDQRRIDVSRTDRIAGDAVLGSFQRRHLGQSDDTVLGRDVGRLEGRSDQSMRGGDVDDPPELVLRIAGRVSRVV